MIVVDTNVLGYLLIPNELTGAAALLLEADPAWAAPYLWRSELRNVLAMYMRKGQIDLALALEMLERASRLVTGREFTVPDASVMQLVESTVCSAYDCEFVALALDLRVPLMTTDSRVLRTFPSVARDLRSFAARPPTS